MSASNLSPDTTRILRHAIAAIAFRSSRALKGAPSRFESIRLAEDGMSAGELLLHMSNVLAFAVSIVSRAERIRYEPLDWDAEVERFYALLGDLDAKLAEGAALEPGMDLKLVQGPLADALTHIGQLHSMRRKAGAPVPRTNYVQADVRIGRTRLADQPD